MIDRFFFKFKYHFDSMRVNSESISMRYFEIISIELETILELE